MEISQTMLKYIMFNYNNLKMNKSYIRILISGETYLTNHLPAFYYFENSNIIDLLIKLDALEFKIF